MSVVRITTVTFESNEAADIAAAKNKVIDSIQGIVSIDTKVGSVILNHIINFYY